MSVNVKLKLIAGAALVLAALYYWLAYGQQTPDLLKVFYLFTFRMFRFADILWTVAGVALLYRGIQEAREA